MPSVISSVLVSFERLLDLESDFFGSMVIACIASLGDNQAYAALRKCPFFD